MTFADPGLLLDPNPTDPNPPSYDPFTVTGEAGKQAGRLRAYCQIVVAGDDVTNKLDPHLVSVVAIDEDRTSAHIELDDRDGTLPIPPINSPVSISMGWPDGMALVFHGLINDIEYGFGRKEGGRRMWVHAEGVDRMSNVKTPRQNHWGEGAPPGQEIGNMIPLGQVLQDVAKYADSSIKRISPQFAGLKRDYWSQNNVSGEHMLQDIAEQVGGVAKIEGVNQMSLLHPEDIQGNVNVEWGGNLIGMRVRPFVAAGSWASNNQQFFSVLSGQWNGLKQALNMPNPWGAATGAFHLPRPAPNSNDAAQQNSGGGDAYPGIGRILINGEPQAKMWMSAMVSGVRDGVDGQYLIVKVEHHYSRAGYVTWMDVKAIAKAAGSHNVGRAYTVAPVTTAATAAPPPAETPAQAPTTFGQTILENAAKIFGQFF